MENIHGLLIENGVLKHYLGSDTDVVIPEGVTEIGERVFFGREAMKRTTLTSITIPESVTKIGWSAFSGCVGLTSITIPAGVTEIGNSAFENCTGLTSVTIPEGITEIDVGTFSGCTGLTSVSIPEGVTEIGSSAFSGCTGLASVTIPECVRVIGAGAFSGYTGLTSVTIPEGVTSILGETFWGDSGAFKGCTGLTSVVLPKSVTKIDKSVFDGCRPVLIAPHIPVVNFGKEDRHGACCGFARLYFEGAELDVESRTGYLKYIKNQKKKIFPTAVKYEELLRLMFAEKFVTRKDIDLLLAECDKQNNVETKAVVLEYTHQSFEPTDTDKNYKL